MKKPHACSGSGRQRSPASSPNCERQTFFVYSTANLPGYGPHHRRPAIRPHAPHEWRRPQRRSLRGSRGPYPEGVDLDAGARNRETPRPSSKEPQLQFRAKRDGATASSHSGRPSGSGRSTQLLPGSFFEIRDRPKLRRRRLNLLFNSRSRRGILERLSDLRESSGRLAKQLGQVSPGRFLRDRRGLVEKARIHCAKGSSTGAADLDEDIEIEEVHP